MAHIAACLLLAAITMPMCAWAYPSRFVQLYSHNNCMAQPQLGGNYGPHAIAGPVATDPTITFQASADGAAASTSLCPGKTYQLQVALPGGRGYLLTTSQGSWQGISGQCPNRQYSDVVEASVSTALNVPCTATGSLQIVITTSKGDRQQHLQNSVTFNLDPNCKPASCSSPAASPPPGISNGPSDSSNLSQAAKDLLTLANTAPGCTSAPKAVGYLCNREISSQLRLSYVLSTDPTPPPNNPCTQPFQTTASSLVLPPGAQAWLHAMFSSPADGWVSLAFPQKAGKMIPADAVLGGYTDQGNAYGGTYHLTDYVLPGADQNSWAANIGAYQQTTPDRRTVVCFTRAVALPGNTLQSAVGRKLAQTTVAASVPVPVIDTVIPFNWATAAADDFSQHTHTGGFTLNLVTGEFHTVDDVLKAKIIAHGALMLAAFLGLMPTAILIARHRRLVPATKVAGKDIWFWLHVFIQVLAVSCFAAGIGIAFNDFSLDNIPSAGDVLDAHQAIGITLIVLIGVQLLIGLIRPAPDAKHRRIWNHLHHNWGRFLLLLTWVDIALGIYLYNELYKPSSDTDSTKPYVAWTAAAVVIAGVVLSIAIALEVISIIAAKRGRQHRLSSSDGLKTEPSGNSSQSSSPSATKTRNSPQRH